MRKKFLFQQNVLMFVSVKALFEENESIEDVLFFRKQ